MRRLRTYITGLHIHEKLTRKWPKCVENIVPLYFACDFDVAIFMAHVADSCMCLRYTNRPHSGTISAHMIEYGNLLLHTLIIYRFGKLYRHVFVIQPYTKSVPHYFSSKRCAPRTVRFDPPRMYWRSERMNIYINRIYTAVTYGYDGVYFTPDEYDFIRANSDRICDLDAHIISHSNPLLVSSSIFDSLAHVINM